MENSPSNEFSLTDLVTMLSAQEVNANSPTDSRRVMITEVIHVPTSEHVAQIVGKAGSKIKALRAKTNTCIKTPLRGDQPIFTITGNPDDVRMARLAIQHAAQHFTNLMTSRSNSCAPGEVTILVPVPQQYVGVVVGRGGTVIMKIKEQTNTRINTPKDDSPATAFEVTGSQVNVLAAKEAIEEKVRQAFQLRSSSIFDPDLNKSVLNHNSKVIQVPQNINAYTQLQNELPTCNLPVAEQSARAKSKNDETKSLLAKSDNIHINTGNRQDDIGNILYENFCRFDNTYGFPHSVWNY